MTKKELLILNNALTHARVRFTEALKDKDAHPLNLTAEYNVAYSRGLLVGVYVAMGCSVTQAEIMAEMVSKELK